MVVVGVITDKALRSCRLFGGILRVDLNTLLLRERLEVREVGDDLRLAVVYAGSARVSGSG